MSKWVVVNKNNIYKKITCM